MVGVGCLLLLAGMGVGLWAGSALGWRRALGLDARPAQAALPALVFAGPYRFVRHPRALAVILLSLGAGWMAEPLPSWACVTTASGALIAAVWRERQLVGFGEAYARYRKAVPFLVPCRVSRTPFSSFVS